MTKMNLAKNIESLISKWENITRYKESTWKDRIDKCRLKVEITYMYDDYLIIHIPEEYEDKLYKILLQIEMDLERRIEKLLDDKNYIS